MNKEKEAKGILEKVLTMLSGVDKKAEVMEDVVAEVELSEEAVETVVEEVVIEATQEDAQEVIEEPIEAELSAEPKVNYVTAEDFEKFKTELTAIVKGKVEEVEAEKVELSEQVVELSAQPATEPILHSPEMNTEGVSGFRYAQNKPKGMMDNVIEQLSKYK